jgi:hypothetical protein
MNLATETVYRNGSLVGSSDEKNGALLPSGYATTAKAAAERRMILVGYRLADRLRIWLD